MEAVDQTPLNAFSAGRRSANNESSIALPQPTSRGSTKVAPPSGITPMRANACRKNAPCEAQMMSPIMARLMPTPAAAPCTAVTMGISRSRSSNKNGW